MYLILINQIANENHKRIIKNEKFFKIMSFIFTECNQIMDEISRKNTEKFHMTFQINWMQVLDYIK